MKTITVSEVTVIRGSGTDKLYFKTALTAACWPYEGTEVLRVDCAAGQAEKWLKINGFEELPMKVINH